MDEYGDVEISTSIHFSNDFPWLPCGSGYQLPLAGDGPNCRSYLSPQHRDIWQCWSVKRSWKMWKVVGLVAFGNGLGGID